MSWKLDNEQRNAACGRHGASRLGTDRRSVATTRGCKAACVLVVLLAGALPGRAAWIYDGRPSTWEGIPPALKADEYVYPVFLLPLGGQWTDFELKASTNNFESLVYYVLSSAANVYADDPAVWVYFTDDHSSTVLRWNKAETATPIGSQLADPVNSEVEYVVVMPSHEGAVDWRGWMSRDNHRLMWSFVRYDGLSLEMNASGTRSHWNPVVPVEWRKRRIAP